MKGKQKSGREGKGKDRTRTGQSGVASVGEEHVAIAVTALEKAAIWKPQTEHNWFVFFVNETGTSNSVVCSFLLWRFCSQSTKATVVKILLASFSLQSRPFQSSTRQPSLVETEAMKLLDVFLGISQCGNPKWKGIKAMEDSGKTFKKTFSKTYFCVVREHTHMWRSADLMGWSSLKQGLLLALCCMLQVSWPMSFWGNLLSPPPISCSGML